MHTGGGGMAVRLKQETRQKPQIFLGSAKESLEDLYALQTALAHGADMLAWSAHDARPKDFDNFLDRLIGFAQSVDAAVFLADATDFLKKRHRVFDVCRDNVMFEIALFVGVLGKDRVFIVVPDGTPLGWPSDISTLSPKCYSRPGDKKTKNYKAMLQTAMQPIAQEILEQVARRSAPANSKTGNDQPCAADWAVLKQREEVSGVASVDSSNLFFLFCSPADCERTYLEIQTFCTEHNVAHLCEVEAAYDLMGNWDLLVRVRVRKESSTFFSLLKSYLLTKACIADDTGSPFSRWQLIDVKQRARQFSALSNGKGGKSKELIDQLFLNDTEEYQRQRASRSFIFIDTSDANGDNHLDADSRKTSLLSELSASLSQGIGKAASQIIEAVSLCDKGIVIETFSTCAQSAAINDLNRAIGKLLAVKALQKYTLSCYAYREGNLREKARRK
jgi:hypothetical protein